MLHKIFLKKNEERRLKAGHLWVYSNEIDIQKSPLKDCVPGELVALFSSSNKPLGVGYINPNTLLCVRLLSRDEHQAVDVNFFKEKIQNALALRSLLFSKPYYRLVYGESDFLPGVVIDRFGETVVIQINTAGMEALKDLLLDAVMQVLSPKVVVWRNDSGARAVEGLENYVSVAFGDTPETIQLEENGVSFQAPLLTGQKTAWFYDHRLNRARLENYVKGKRVLDVFSYLGAWGIQALKFGAKAVVSIDSSSDAIEQQRKNAELNQVQDQLQLITADAFQALKDLIKAGEKFDVVIVDPPAFIKRRKDIKEGMKAYFHLNDLALKLLNNSGLLVSASCSQHLEESDLLDLIRSSGLQNGYTLQVLERGHQGPDHPLHFSIPETEYLKALFIFKA